MIASGGHGASLRFGHDTALFRLLTLLGIQLPVTGMEDIVPMAANLQLVFCRGGENGNVWVLFLLNEQPVAFGGVPPVYGSFYHWNDVKYVMR